MGESNDRLIKARLAAGYPTAEAAIARFHWTASTYRSHENGQTPVVPVKAAHRYADAYGVSPGWILTGEGDPLGVDWMMKDAPEDFRREVRNFVKFRLEQLGEANRIRDGSPHPNIDGLRERPAAHRRRGRAAA
jgi:hypothetical protein